MISVSSINRQIMLLCVIAQHLCLPFIFAQHNDNILKEILSKPEAAFLTKYERQVFKTWQKKVGVISIADVTYTSHYGDSLIFRLKNTSQNNSNSTSRTYLVILTSQAKVGYVQCALDKRLIPITQCSDEIHSFLGRFLYLVEAGNITYLQDFLFSDDIKVRYKKGDNKTIVIKGIIQDNPGGIEICQLVVTTVEPLVNLSIYRAPFSPPIDFSFSPHSFVGYYEDYFDDYYDSLQDSIDNWLAATIQPKQKTGKITFIKNETAIKDQIAEWFKSQYGYQTIYANSDNDSISLSVELVLPPVYEYFQEHLKARIDLAFAEKQYSMDRFTLLDKVYHIATIDSLLLNEAISPSDKDFIKNSLMANERLFCSLNIPIPGSGPIMTDSAKIVFLLHSSKVRAYMDLKAAQWRRLLKNLMCGKAVYYRPIEYIVTQDSTTIKGAVLAKWLKANYCDLYEICATHLSGQEAKISALTMDLFPRIRMDNVKSFYANSLVKRVSDKQKVEVRIKR